MSDGMGREFMYLSSHATNRYFIPNWGKDYYSGDEFVINVHNNSADNCYIQKAELNGTDWIYAQLDHVDFAKGGTLNLWLGNMPNKSWGKLKYLGFKTNK